MIPPFSFPASSIPEPRRRQLLTSVLVSGLFAIVSSSLWGAEVPFSAAMTGAGSEKTRHLELVDLDADGDLDILFASDGSNDIAWLDNVGGDASVLTKRVIDAAFGSARVARAIDVDGDGDLDVLATSLSLDDVVWFENTAGDASAWTERPIDAAFNGARGIAGADFDLDGDADVVATAWVADDVVWWENTAGDGSAWTPTSIETALDGPRRIDVGDLDGDGDPDLLGVATQEDRVLWWRNDLPAAGGWVQSEIANLFGGARDAHPADIDGDGDLDVVATAGDEDLVAWFENSDGLGGSWDAHVVDGLFQTASEAVASDVDGDGDLDIVAVAAGSDRIAWWENTNGSGLDWNETLIDTGLTTAHAVAVGDLDGDGDADVVGGAANAGELISWWRNETLHRSAVFPFERSIDAAFDGAHHVVAADMDRDGHLDAVATAEAAGEIAWWRNPGDFEATWTKTGVTTTFAGARHVAVADLDSDGDPDLVGAADGDDAILWWENSAGDASAWTEHAIDSTFAGARFVAVADFDRDGDLDVAGAAFDGNRLVWFQNASGDATVWNQVDIDTNFNSPRCLRAADLDQDGDPDLVASAWHAGEVAWFENTGGGLTWVETTIHTATTSGHRRVQIVDLDRDGDLDIVAAATGDDRVLWFENTVGDASAWTVRDIDPDWDGAREARAVDVDGDGDLDVVGVSGLLSQVAWWENTAGDASAWAFASVDETVGVASSVAVADLDRDGDQDLLGTAEFADAVRWWDNRGGQFALPTDDVVAEGSPLEGTEVAVLRIEGAHRGRASDSDVEWVSLDLRFTDALDTPLTDPSLNGLVDAARVYLDDGDAAFDPIAETLVHSEGPLTPDPNGELTFGFTLPAAELTFSPGTDPIYWLSLELADDAATKTPDSLIVRHLTESTSSGRMAVTELPLILEYQSDTSSSGMVINATPVLAAGIADQVAIVDQLFELDTAVDVSDPDGDPLTFTLVNGFGFLTLSPDGLLSGLPAAAHVGGSPYTVEIVVDDGTNTAGGELPISFLLSLDSPPEVLTPIGEQRVVVGVDPGLDVSGNFDDPDGDGLSFSATGLPASLNLSVAGLLSGTPVALDITGSPYAVVVTAMDPDGASVDTMFSLVVNEDPQVTGPIPAVQAVEGTNLAEDLSPFFTDPNLDPLTFTATGLPSSLRLSPAGTLHGIPSTLDAGASPYSVEITATDPFGGEVMAPLGVTLALDPDVLLADGFESGDVAGWSATVP